MAAKRSGAPPRKGAPAKSAGEPGSNVSSIGMPSHPQSVMEAEIRRRAYELYEMRGRSDGFDREDWAQAEAEVLSRLPRKESA